jgi:Holliday junction resolvase RusA-like endonuclease
MLRVPSQLINVPIIIPGHPYVKKNTAKGSGTGNYWTSKNYQLWANSAYYHLAHDHGHVLPIDQPINLRCLFYLAKNLHVDQSNLYEGIQDVLVSAGVLLDDHYQIVTGHDGSRTRVDQSNPRTEILITPA